MVKESIDPTTVPLSTVSLLCCQSQVTVLAPLTPSGNYFSLPPFEGRIIQGGGELFEEGIAISSCQRAGKTAF